MKTTDDARAVLAEVESRLYEICNAEYLHCERTCVVPSRSVDDVAKEITDWLKATAEAAKPEPDPSNIRKTDSPVGVLLKVYAELEALSQRPEHLTIAAVPARPVHDLLRGLHGWLSQDPCRPAPSHPKQGGEAEAAKPEPAPIEISFCPRTLLAETGHSDARPRAVVVTTPGGKITLTCTIP